MSKQIEQEFVERYDPIDEIQSTHIERQRSVDYSNEDLYPLDKLQKLGFYWLDEETNPLRSARSQGEASKIARLLAFECAYRTDRIQELIEFYGGQDE